MRMITNIYGIPSPLSNDEVKVYSKIFERATNENDLNIREQTVANSLTSRGFMDYYDNGKGKVFFIR